MVQHPNRDFSSSVEEYQQFHGQNEIQASHTASSLFSKGHHKFPAAVGGSVTQAFLSSVSTGKRTAWELVSISASLFLKNHSHHSASVFRPYARLPFRAHIRPSQLLWPQFLSQLEEESDLQATGISPGFLKKLLLTLFSNIVFYFHMQVNCVYSSQSHNQENNLSCSCSQKNLQNTAHLMGIQKSQTSHGCVMPENIFVFPNLT